MPDTPPQRLIDGPVRLDLVPIPTPQQAPLGAVLIVILLLELNLGIFDVRERYSDLDYSKVDR